METFAGISGQAEGLDHLPDSKFLPPMELNCVEKELKQSMKDKFGRLLTIGRVAHITSPLSHNNSSQRVSVNTATYVYGLPVWCLLQQ